ncbi:hypothetical protein ACHAXR_006425 [Thalassiosira sp. AJA248-18]
MSLSPKPLSSPGSERSISEAEITDIIGGMRADRNAGKGGGDEEAGLPLGSGINASPSSNIAIPKTNEEEGTAVDQGTIGVLEETPLIMSTDDDIEKGQARTPTSTSSPLDTDVHIKESGNGDDGAKRKGKRKSKRKSRKCSTSSRALERIEDNGAGVPLGPGILMPPHHPTAPALEQIEDDVGPIPTNYDDVFDDLDIKRKIAAAPKTNRVLSPSSGAASNNTRVDSDNLTDRAVASDPDQSTAAVSHHANSTATSPGPDLYILEATLVEDRTAEGNERRATEDSERSVYEAEYVPPQPWWKKYDRTILCSIILFGALFVGGALVAQPPDNKDPGDDLVMTVQPSSEFCPTLYSDFNRRQLTYHKDAFDLPYSITNTGGHGEWATRHVPVLTLSADDRLIATILVGSEEEGVYHPKVASENPNEVHFITHIMAKDQDDKVVALESMNPSAAGPAWLSFDVPDGVTMLTPYVWCNVHGLWKGTSVMVTPNQMISTRDACYVSNYPKGAWTSVHADFSRRQHDQPFNSKVPYNETLEMRHTPYITLHDDGVTASVTVGKENISVHPMDTFHFITEIYVMDDVGNIIVMSSLDPTGANVAAIDFNIPQGTSTLTAYSWCNIHGHWVGPTIEV